MYNYLLIIILILIIVTFTFLNSRCNNPVVSIYDSMMPGPNIVLLTATHGNELAPYYAVNAYLKTHKPFRGKLTHVVVNQCGIYFNDREQGIWNNKNDINRKYNSDNPINKKVIEIINKCDLVIDFHEAKDSNYYSKWIGNTITYNTNYIDTITLIEKLNNKFSNSNFMSYNASKFLDIDWIDGSLLQYTTKNHINYILIETNKKDSLSTRKDQTYLILDYIYSKYLT